MTSSFFIVDAKCDTFSSSAHDVGGIEELYKYGHVADADVELLLGRETGCW